MLHPDRNGGTPVVSRKEFMDVGRKLVDAENRLKIISSGPVLRQEIMNAFNNVEALWAELFPAEKYRLLGLFIQKITLWNDRLEMEMKTNGITSFVKELNFREEKK